MLAHRPGGKKEIEEYYQMAPDIVAAINPRKDAAEIWNRVYDELVQPSVRMIHEKKDVEAYRLYKSFTLTCAAQYTCSRNDDLS